MLQPGDIVHDVEIVARLRAGGMAALYLGRRAGAHGFSKQLAIKVIHTHLASDESFVKMFVDEARLSARIDHPNVVRVEALKEHEGTYCLMMEFVHGCSLSQLMSALKKRKTRFSPELAVAIAIRVADGLHAAHELINQDGSPAGVVHRDVSPANVLIGYRGDVKLIDFGIAKATQRMHQTEAAGLKGKIAYMAPEQAFGRVVDRRTDVYALGIMLWEMLAMRRLFSADNDLILLDMVRDPKVLPPSALVPDLPPELERVILEALSKDPVGRPATARDLRYRLLNALPAAAAVDPLQVSAVVCDVMADKIQEDRELLSISSFNVLPTPSQHDSVTLSRLLRPVHTGVDVAESLGHDAYELASGLPSAQARAEPPTVLPHGALRSAPEARRSLMQIFLGAAALLGLFFGGGTAAAIVVLSPDEAPAGAAQVSLPVHDRVDVVEPAAAQEPPPEPVVAGEPALVVDPGATPSGEPAVSSRPRGHPRRRVRRGAEGGARVGVPTPLPPEQDPPTVRSHGSSTGGGSTVGRGLAGEARF